jgi:hypothetical protein
MRFLLPSQSFLKLIRVDGCNSSANRFTAANHIESVSAMHNPTQTATIEKQWRCADTCQRDDAFLNAVKRNRSGYGPDTPSAFHTGEIWKKVVDQVARQLCDGMSSSVLRMVHSGLF